MSVIDKLRIKMKDIVIPYIVDCFVLFLMCLCFWIPVYILLILSTISTHP